MIPSIYALTLIAASSLLLLTLGSVATKRFHFWPPPSNSSWQNRTFWLLFRAMFLGIVVLSILDFGSTQTGW